MREGTHRCETCKHWVRGTVTTYAPDYVIHGRPSPEAGTERRYRHSDECGCFTSDQDVGLCTLPDEGANSGTWLVATADGGYGSVLTDARFGCVLWEPAPEGWDHYERREMRTSESQTITESFVNSLREGEE